MPLTLEQRRQGTSAANVTSQSATYSPAPTAGHLLIAHANSDATLTMTSTGWALTTSSVNETGLYEWWKIAGASESATVTVTPSGAASTEMVIEEWSGNVGSSPVDQATNFGTQAAGGTAATGTTAATTQADDLASASFGWNDTGGVVTGSSYSNLFTEVAEAKGLGTTATNITVAQKALAATGTQTSTMTLSASTGAWKSALIATYKASPTGVTGSSSASGPAVAGEFSPHLNYRMWL